jgi:type IV secretion system protein VirB9
VKKLFLLLFIAFLQVLPEFLISCASVNMEKQVKLEAGAGKIPPREPLILAVPVDSPPPAIIEKEITVYVPEQQANKTTSASKGRPAVEASNSAGIKRPEDYSHAAMVYEYDKDFVYEIYCMPLRAVDIKLEPGERAVEAPFVADSERWMLGAGVSQENGFQIQHIYVKPTESGISSSLIINTDRRVYHLILRSYTDIHMPLVYWKYKTNFMPFNFIPNNNYAASGTPASETYKDASYQDGGAPSADPRFLSFNYKVTYNLFQKPKWIPKLVYDDGKKTYINFKEEIAQMELPGIFENRNDALNYRASGTLIIIDKLIEEITVRLNDRELMITKKRGK